MTQIDPMPSAPEPASSNPPPLPQDYAPPPAPAASGELLSLAASAGRGGRWFYWIAGLSLVNLVMMITRAGTYFVIGLALPIIAGQLAEESGSEGKALAAGVSVVAAGLFAMFGYFATRRMLWAFIVGMVLYGIDAGIFLLLGDWMSVAFHVFALLCLMAGARSCARFGKLSMALGAR